MGSRRSRRLVLVPALAVVVATGLVGGVAAAAPLPGPASWQRSDALAATPPISAVATSATGAVAVGDGIWFSADAQTWTSVLDRTALGGRLGGQEGSLDSVTAFGSGFVAAGQAVDPVSEQAVAAIWTSPDGRRWTRARSAALEPATPAIPQDNTTPTRGAVHAVTSGGPGLVAVGGVFAGTFDGPTLMTPPDEPAVWTSADGARWTRADTRDSFGSGPSPLTLTSVTTYRGSVVAAAQYGSSSQIYTSRDGDHWRMIGAVDGGVAQLGVRGHTVVAVGSSTNGSHRERATIWTSPDARHWRRTFASGPAGLADFTSVAASGRSLVAVGYRGNSEPLVDAIVSVSMNGRTWKPVTQAGTAFATRTYFEAAAVFQKRSLAFGVETYAGTGAATDPFRSRTVVFTSSP